jgi:carbon-monoxide dehydrogenase medium subunit
MKAAAFNYNRPTDLTDAVTQLSRQDAITKPMGGSQSLGPMLNMRLVRAAQIVDVSALPELLAVNEKDGVIQIGAGITHAQIEDGVHAALVGHPMQGVARDIAYRAVRTRGTIGGSVAHADPAADWVVVLTALDATLQLQDANSTRSVPMNAFMQGAYTTQLNDGELITRVDVPKLSSDARWGYYKTCRKPGEFADASAAVLFDPADKAARIVLGALDGPPRHLADLAAHVARDGASTLDRTTIVAAVKTVVDPSDSVQCKLHAVCVERALRSAIAEAA